MVFVRGLPDGDACLQWHPMLALRLNNVARLHRPCLPQDMLMHLIAKAIDAQLSCGVRARRQYALSTATEAAIFAATAAAVAKKCCQYRVL